MTLATQSCLSLVTVAKLGRAWSANRRRESVMFGRGFPDRIHGIGDVEVEAGIRRHNAAQPLGAQSAMVRKSDEAPPAGGSRHCRGVGSRLSSTGPPTRRAHTSMTNAGSNSCPSTRLYPPGLHRTRVPPSRSSTRSCMCPWIQQRQADTAHSPNRGPTRTRGSVGSSRTTVEWIAGSARDG